MPAPRPPRRPSTPRWRRRAARPRAPTARTAASRPASSPTPTLTFSVVNPSATAAAASAAAPARSTAPIAALTGTGAPDRARQQRRHRPRRLLALEVPQREVDRRHRLRQPGLEPAGVDELLAVAVGGVLEQRPAALQRRPDGVERDAVVGLERRGLADADDLALLDLQLQHGAFAQLAVGRAQRRPEREPPLARPRRSPARRGPGQEAAREQHAEGRAAAARCWPGPG